MEKINLVNLIYRQLELEDRAKREERKNKREFRHFPSGLCAIIDGQFAGKCRRASYYSMNKIEETNPMGAVALMKTTMGEVIHEYMGATLERALFKEFGEGVKVITKAGTDQSKESFRFQDKNLQFPFSGRIDKVVEFNGKITGIVAGEWKSTYGKGVGYIQRDGAKIEHVLQCFSYFLQQEILVDAMWLIYIARDSGYMYGFQVELVDGKLVSRHLNSDVVRVFDVKWPMVIEALLPLEKAINDQQCPDRDYVATVNPKTNRLMQKSPWQCRYCSYMSLCYGCEAEPEDEF